MEFVAAPRITLSAELRWILRAAFIEPNADALEPKLDAPRLDRLCRDLDLRARIAGRVPFSRLERLLGSEIARAFAQHRLAVTAGNRTLLAGLERVGAVARELGAPVAALKFAALVLGNCVAAGDRDARDVDLLVREADAARLWEALVKRGYEPLGDAVLAPLYGPERELIELKTRVAGVRASSGAPATFDSLAGRAETSVNAAAAATVRASVRHLDWNVVAAHLLVHALVQHANATNYPTFRVLCDFADLTRCGVLSAPQRVLDHVAPPASTERLRAAMALSSGLSQGRDPETWPASSLERRVFDHLIAASCDANYRSLLRVQRARDLYRTGKLLPKLMGMLSERGSLKALASGAIGVGTSWLLSVRSRHL